MVTTLSAAGPSNKRVGLTLALGALVCPSQGVLVTLDRNVSY